ncbi:MAG: carbamoyltransferase [Bryobacterales bacterium]|nr:carbamoyltransferase [Bryobacterales bacterium]
MVILGIGGILSDAAAALIKDGDLIAAVEQRKIARYTRVGDVPEEAIDACLNAGRVERSRVDYVAVVRPIGAGPETAVHVELRGMFPNAQVVLLDHHTAHAASAYFASPFDEATVLSLDRQGDLRCGARWTGRGPHLDLDRELYFPDSLGDLYSRVTALLGYQQNADEHKVQWLSMSGDDRFVELFETILGVPNGGWPRLDRSFLDNQRLGRGAFSSKFYSRIGMTDEGEISAPLRPHLAAGVQRAVERAVADMAGSGKNLALAGGLAFNALLVASLERSGAWENVFVQPASGNAGTSIGAALYTWHSIARQTARASIKNLCLGPAFTPEEVKQVLENCKLSFRYLLTTGELVETAVSELNEHKIIAWMQGAMEFGPRALGNRSILASPLNPYSTENLNAFIKHREAFRKFAASVPAELCAEYFEAGPNARFLATVGVVKPAHRTTFESAILGENLVRIHAVHKEDNPLYWTLLHAAGKATGLPVLYNTSFNLFGDPLVCTPRDAVRSFYSSGIDSMFVGNFHLEK